jgi:PAS domain-containing protein
LRAVLDSLDTGVVACDRDGFPTLSNPPIRGLYGLPEEPVPPTEWPSYYRLWTTDRKTPIEPASTPLARALRGERLHNVEFTIVVPGDFNPERIAAMLAEWNAE